MSTTEIEERTAEQRVEQSSEQQHARQAKYAVPYTELIPVFNLLNNHTRLGILLLLCREMNVLRRGLWVGQIVGRFKLTQPTISRHLDMLVDAGLLTRTRKKQRMVYKVAVGELRRVGRKMQELGRLLETVKIQDSREQTDDERASEQTNSGTANEEQSES